MDSLKIQSQTDQDGDRMVSNKCFSRKHIPPHGPLLTPKILPFVGLSPQNGRRPVWDVAELVCKISCRLVKPRLRNPLPYIKTVKKAQ